MSQGCLDSRCPPTRALADEGRAAARGQQFLSAAILELSDESLTERELYCRIAEQTREFVGGGIVTMCSFLRERRAFRIEAIAGAGEMLAQLLRELGRDPLVMSNGDFEPFTQAALMRLGKRLQIPDDVWSALADWLDSNDEQRPGGAESSYYMTLKPAYRARNNKPLATLSELSLVKGFTPEIVSKLVPFVTVYSEPGSSSLTRSKVNINTAPLEVIAALDKKIDDTLAERVLEERRLRPFKSVAELSRISGLEALSIELGKSATVKGNVFRITSVAQIKDTARTVEAVIWLSGEVLSWQEY